MDAPPPIPAHQPGLGRRHGQGQARERDDRAGEGERGSTESKLVPEVMQRKEKKRRSSTCQIALGVLVAAVLWPLVSYQIIAVRPCMHPDATFPDRPPPTMVSRTTILEATQGQISSQSPTDATSSRWYLYGS